MSPISSTFKDRVVEAASILIKKEGGKINYMKLVKLLYLADRLSIEENEVPITYDNFSAMPKGMVVSTTLDLVKNKKHISQWNKNFETKKLIVSVKGQYPRLKKLCLEDVEILEKTYSKYGNLDQYQLAEITERVPEWKDPNGSSFPVGVKELLLSMGKNEDDSERIESQILEISKLDLFFGK